MSDTWSHRVLANGFRDFYSDLSDLGAEVDADPRHFTRRAGDSEEEREAAGRQAAARVRQRLRAVLREQGRELGRAMGPEGARRLEEGQYVMAALADEVFLNLDWEGREAWAEELMEAQLFDTQLAGETVFDRAEELLREPDEADWDLAYIYLSAISLGFLGRYRGAPNHVELRGLRRRLLNFVTRGRTTLADDIDPLFPQAGAHTLDASESFRLPPVRRWGWIVAFLVLGYVAVSHLVWLDASRELRDTSGEMARARAEALGVVR